MKKSIFAFLFIICSVCFALDELIDKIPTTPKQAENLYQTTIQRLNEGAQQLKNCKSALEFLYEYDETFGNFRDVKDTFESLSLVTSKPKMRSTVNELFIKLEQALATAEENYPIYFQMLNFFDPPQNREDRLYYEKLCRLFVHHGAHLPKEKRLELKKIKHELSGDINTFKRNVFEDESNLIVDVEELNGLNKSFVDHLPKNAFHKVILGTDYPTYFHIMKYCTNKDLRKRYYHIFHNRAKNPNCKLLKQVADKRHKLAHLFGYENFAEYDLKEQTVQSPTKVMELLNSLLQATNSSYKHELSLLNPNKEPLAGWDIIHLLNNYSTQALDVDLSLIKQYFPLETTLRNMLKLFGKFFDFEFKLSSISLWNERLYQVHVYDKDKHLGIILLDLFPRKYKYSHACCSSFFAGKRAQTSLSLIIANFAKPNAAPSLLNFMQLQTLFHEFGHALHNTVSKTSYKITSGYNVAIDFVEMPSQLFEYWLTIPEVLVNLSEHYQTKEQLSYELADKLCKSDQLAIGFHVRTQCLLSLFSLMCYTNFQPDLYQQLVKTYFLTINFGDTQRQANFFHLMEYGPKYYGYLYSNVLAANVFQQILKEGINHPSTGRKYLKTILSKGDSEHPRKLLKRFLDRPIQLETFLSHIGIKPTP